MSVVHSPVTIGLAVLGFIGLTMSAPGQDTKVTSTLETVGAIADGTNYRIQGDGGGAYVSFSSRRPSDAVESILQTSNTCCNDWILNTKDSISRSILVDFRDPAPGSSVTDAPFSWNQMPSRILAECHQVNVQFPAMTDGQSADCPVVISFSTGGKSYRISIGNLGQPGTEPARVTCTRVDGANKCDEWTLVPAAEHDGEAKSIGRLLIVPKNGPLIPVGDFYFTFSFRVAK